MAKFNRLYYYTSKGEKKLNCYNIPVPKELVEKAQLENIDIEIVVEKGKIILQPKILQTN